MTLLADHPTPPITGTLLAPRAAVPHELTPAELATVDRESADRASAHLAPAAPGTEPVPTAGAGAAADGTPAAGAEHPARRRAALAEELACVRRWQRLAQARLDLVTDRLSPAGALAALDGTTPAAGTPSGAPVRAAGRAAGHVDVADVVALLRGRTEHAGYDAADDLRAVVAARRELAARGAELQRRLAAADEEPRASAPSTRA